MNAPPNGLRLNRNFEPVGTAKIRRAVAFTLIEMLIAVAISAMILASICAVFFGALRLRDTASDAASQTLPTDRAIDIMRNDLLAIVPVGVLAGPMGTDASATGMLQQPLLEIFSSSAIINADDPWGDVQKVDYWLQFPTNKTGAPGRDLMRGVTRNLLPPSPIQPTAQSLLHGVQNLQFSYYDGTNWNQTWSTTLSNIPIAIKVSIDFATSRGDGQVKPPVQFLVPIVTWCATNSITNQVTGN